MLPPGKKAAAPSVALLAFYNAIPSLFWSVLSLVPLCVFCYQHMARPWLYGLLAVSLLAYGLSTSWFPYWQLSTRSATYRKLGVPFVNRFTQNGDFVNRLVRRQYPNYRRVRHRASAAPATTKSGSTWCCCSSFCSAVSMRRPTVAGSGYWCLRLLTWGIISTPCGCNNTCGCACRYNDLFTRLPLRSSDSALVV
ncbi:hypothetical protein [Hymenobacter volaticus]|uniref:Uncharacterized protein n=1 Tax=Hymenobacter volaticus TaxID=2932254 RepID=A0ABY4G5W4_9BACT|nr:hypothetical protein [Hymenobacter volaticus]UOQ66157.1 hypothetical protein MUN86_22125 [Hymenobacter volaticus]